ncbi:MAG: Rne/Rng family ribonuclease [Bacteroidota bacterium]|nr:Rne/Rng family ribonuclease [Bacteroidota bacterium]
MTKELIIQSSKAGADIALLEDRRLVELHHDSVEENFLVGDVFIGRVRKVVVGLNAAFVDIGHERDAFLHYLDLGPDVRSSLRFTDLIKKGKFRESRLQNFRFEPEIKKDGKIDEVLVPNQLVIVQIVKEPISTKGPRLTSQLSLSGRYLVLMPFSEGLSISKKIKGREERDRLKKILSALKPKNFGLIIRTNAEEISLEELETDLRNLLEGWDKLVRNLADGKTKIYSELDRTESILRDLLNDSFGRIAVDNAQVYKQIRSYIQNIAPGKEEIVKLYKNTRPLFEQFEVDKQVKSLFNKIVNLGGGAYLIIEHTEAMHVIDVNSGSRRSQKDDQEENALKTNLEAGTEIARQLRLRDMGGIIVIDFIDLRGAANRKLIYDSMKDMMKDDRAKHTILPLTKFGIMQITRQRVRQERNLDISEPCPVCNGTGEVAKGMLPTEDIEHRLQDYIRTSGKKSVTLKVNPLIHAYFTKGLISRQWKWFFNHGWRVKVVPTNSLMLTQYEIVEK